MENVIWQMENENASKSLPDCLFTRGDAAHLQSLHIGVGHFPFDLSDRLAGGVEPGIADALVVDVDQRVNEAFADRRQFAHGDGAFIELAVGDHAVDDLFDYRADVFGSVLFERADRGFGAVILMLADGAEDSVRSLEEHTPENIRAIVKKIVDSVVADGQLDESTVTMRELTTIRESLINTLINIYHQRISYPGFNPPSKTIGEVEREMADADVKTLEVSSVAARK